MRKEPAVLGALLALLLAGATPRAQAQTEQTTKEAEARFKEGLHRHDTGDEEGARLSFLQAYSVLKRPNILFNLARAEQLTGHPVEALAHYKLFVADSAVTGADRETAKKRVLELTPLTGHVAIDAPAGAELSIDGQALASRAPLREPADVAAGTHTVVARLDDQTQTVIVTCAAGETVTAKVDIVRTGAPLVVLPIAGEAAATPPSRPEPERGSQVENSSAKIVTVAALGVAAAALAGTGIALDVASANDLTNAENALGSLAMGRSPSSVCYPNASSPACQAAHIAAETHVSRGNEAVGMLAGAGVLGAAAIMTWSFWPKKRTDGARVVPVVSPAMAGLGVSGSF